MMGPTSKDYSEATALEIDQEVADLVSRAHQQAREVLETQRATLEKAAKILLEKEVLEGEELRQILNSAPPPEKP
jgi:cell division protease FtsH